MTVLLDLVEILQLLHEGVGELGVVVGKVSHRNGLILVPLNIRVQILNLTDKLVVLILLLHKGSGRVVEVGLGLDEVVGGDVEAVLEALDLGKKRLNLLPSFRGIATGFLVGLRVEGSGGLEVGDFSREGLDLAVLHPVLEEEANRDEAGEDEGDLDVDDLDGHDGLRGGGCESRGGDEDEGEGEDKKVLLRHGRLLVCSGTRAVSCWKCPIR